MSVLEKSGVPLEPIRTGKPKNAISFLEKKTGIQTTREPLLELRILPGIIGLRRLFAGKNPYLYPIVPRNTQIPG